jgi:hypothetical protein
MRRHVRGALGAAIVLAIGIAVVPVSEALAANGASVASGLRGEQAPVQARFATGAEISAPISLPSEPALRAHALSSSEAFASKGPPARAARESPITAPTKPFTGGPTGDGVT